MNIISKKKKYHKAKDNCKRRYSLHIIFLRNYWAILLLDSVEIDLLYCLRSESRGRINGVRNGTIIQNASNNDKKKTDK